MTLREIGASKDHAAPTSRMPAHSRTANHGGRHHDTRSDYNWRYDDYCGRPSIRQTSSTWPAVKARAASLGSTGAADAEQREHYCGCCR